MQKCVKNATFPVKFYSVRTFFKAFTIIQKSSEERRIWNDCRTRGVCSRQHRELHFTTQLYILQRDE